MKNLFILGILFFSSTSLASSKAQANEALSETEANLSGSVDGYNVRNGDDKLDFGLVIPTLSKTQVMDFNLSYVLSSETSVIRAAGQRIEVPSNLSLPRQSERYSIITIRIDKPEFKLPITTSELPPEVVVLEGSFPFARTVDTLRSGRPLFAVINSFTFKSYALSTIAEPESALSLTVGENVVDGEEVEFNSPFSEDPDYVTLGLNMASTLQEDGSSRYFPVDLKTLERTQVLKTDSASETTPLVVSIPKDVFESAADASTKPFPFTMVWGEATPEVSLPLAKDFISSNTEDPELMLVDIDFTKVLNVNTLAIKTSFLDAKGTVIRSAFETGPFQDIISHAISMSIPEEAVRTRVDVYAADVDPVKTTIILENALTEDDILNEAKYITRYEDDLD